MIEVKDIVKQMADQATALQETSSAVRRPSRPLLRGCSAGRPAESCTAFVEMVLRARSSVDVFRDDAAVCTIYGPNATVIGVFHKI